MNGPQVAAPGRCRLGEGPLWHDEWHQLVWVDIEDPAIFRFDPATGATTRTPLSAPVGAIALRTDGRMICAAKGGFGDLDPDTGQVDIFAPVRAQDADVRMNDAKVDPRGRYWAGLMAEDAAAGRAELYRLETDGRLTCVLKGLTIPNGLDWSLDERTMYFIDTADDHIGAYEFDPDSGELGARRVFAGFDREAGVADGLTVDASGGVWVAFCFGAVVRHYSPTGELLDEITMPVSMPTSCAFGGDDLAALFVTSATTTLSPQQLIEQPSAGSLFRVEGGVRGRPSFRYAG